MSQNTVNVSPEQIQREWGGIQAELNAMGAIAQPVDISAEVPEFAANDASGFDDVPSYQVDVGDILFPPLRICADKFAPNWEISDQECQALAGSAGRLIDHYFPGLVDSGGPVMEFALVVMAVAGSRMGKPRHLQQVGAGGETAGGIMMKTEVSEVAANDD